MRAPIFQLAKASAAVTALLGVSVTRFFPFGSAPQKGTPTYALPYAVYQTVYGSPENYVNQRPDMDNWGLQVDAYAQTMQQSRDVIDALAQALEGDAHVVSWGIEEQEPETKLYRSSLTVEFYTPR